MTGASIYTVGGTVQAGGGVYLPRHADDELLALCRSSTFAYVLTPRQMGKSSLMVQTAETLEAEGIRSAIVDLQDLGAQVTVEQWYFGFLVKLEDQLLLETDVVSWWRDREHLGVSQRLTQFFESVLLTEIPEPIVIFVDEIDTTLSLDFTDDFFTAIRYLYLARAHKPVFQRLSFVLVGVATPGDLIHDPKRTPFNIGQRVDLTDFTQAEALPLAEGFGLPADQATQVLGWVMQWTGGHPYLTQRLCRALVDAGQLYWTKEAVDRVVGSTFLGAMSEQDNNLQFVRDMLTKRATDMYGVLTTYREVWRGRHPVLDEEQSLNKSHLKLSGVVKRADGALTVRNPIYREVFDHQWVKSHLPVNWMQRIQRARGVALMSMLLVLISVPLSVFAFNQASEAKHQRKMAQDNASLAQDIANIAKDKELEARLQAKIAKQNALEAKKQATLAKQRLAEAQLANQKTKDALKAVAEQRQQALFAQGLAQQGQREAQRQTLLATQQRNFAHIKEREAVAQKEITENQKTNAEIITQSLISKNLFASGLGLNALVESLKIGQRLKQVGGVTDAGTRMQAIVVLQQVIDDIREHNRLEGHNSSVDSVSFSPDGKMLASASQDETVKLWNLQGQLLHTLQGHSDRVYSVSFSPDGKTLASASADNTVKLWNLQGQLLRTLQGHSDGVNSISFSLDGKTLASASADSTVKLWNLQGQLLRTLQGSSSVNSVSFSPDGKTLASADGYGIVKLWNLQGQLLRAFQGHRFPTTSISFSPNGDTFASASRSEKTVKLWNLQGQLLRTLQGSSSVNSVSFSPDGKTLASADGYGIVKLWNLQGQALRILPSERSVLNILPSERSVLEGHRGPVNSLSFSPDGKTLASASADSTVKLWNLQGQLLRTLQGHSDSVNSVSFSPDGKTLASASQDNTVKLWNLQGQALYTLQGQDGSISSVSFSPDGKTLAFATLGGMVKLWNLQGALLHTLQGHHGSVTSVSFSPDGKTLASASADSTVKLWNLQGALLHTLQGHSDGVNSISFSPDGKTLASASQDNTVKLWNLQGQELQTFEGHILSATSVSFSPDSKTLASADSLGTIILWNLDLDDLMARGCDWLYDYLTTNPNVSKADRHLCDGVGRVRKVSAVPEPNGERQWFAWAVREWRALVGG